MEAARQLEPVREERRGPAGEAVWARAVAAFTEDLSARGYSAYTLRDYRADVMRLAGYLDVGPEQVARRHLQTLHHVLEEEGMTLGARRRRISAMSRFVTFMSSRRGEPRIGPRLLRASMRTSPLDQLLVGLVYLGCLRLQEIAHLEGRDIRIRKGLIRTRLGYRLVPMHPRLLEIVRGVRYQVPLAAYRPLLPGVNGFSVNARTLHGRFQRLVVRVGLGDIKPDALRREVSHFLVKAGTPPGLVQALLGKDRGLPVAPRKGRLTDLSCLRGRLRELPV